MPCFSVALARLAFLILLLATYTSGTWTDEPFDDRVQEALGGLPLYFIENRGQTDPRVSYYVQGDDTSVYFTADGVTFSLTGEEPKSDPNAFRPSEAGVETAPDRGGTPVRWTVKQDFVGANLDVTPAGQGLTDAVVSYFRGPQSEWKTSVPTYGGIIYSDLWPGIDLVYSGSASKLKYTLMVKPGADPGAIRLAYRGASAVTLNNAGQLAVSTPIGGLLEDRPYVYQQVAGRRVEVPTAYSLGPSAHYGFGVGAYDRSKALVIDPGIVYSTYLGGSSPDDGKDVAFDGSGSAYVTGLTLSPDFPTTVGVYDTSYNGGPFDAFVTKFNPAGSGIVYSTYLGGSYQDVGGGIEIDGSGNAHVAGQTESSDFPTTAGAFDTSFNGPHDAFVAKLNASGSALIYSTYLGGAGTDTFGALAVDAVGSAYVTGYSTHSNFPTTAGAFDTSFNGGGGDAYVAKLNASGSALVYSTYVGGASAFENGTGIAVDGPGSAYLGGYTDSPDFPTTAGAFDTSHNGGTDAFVSKLNASGSGLAYSTYLGGAAGETGQAIAVDLAASAYLAGTTTSAGFPTTVGAFDTSHNGSNDVFVSKLNASGSALAYSTHLGGTSTDYAGSGIALDGSGSAYVAGQTASSDFPTSAGAFDMSYNGSDDGFVSKLDASGSGIAYSTYLGGAQADVATGVTVDGSGSAYVTGQTDSSGFPTTAGAFDTSFNGGAGGGAGPGDAFVTKFDMAAATPTPTPTPGPPTPTPTPIPPGPPVVGGIAGLADTPADPALAGASGPSTGDYAWPAAAAVALMTVVLGGAFVRRRRRD